VVSIQTVLSWRIHIIILHNIFKRSYTGHNQSKLVPFAGKKIRFIFNFIKIKNFARHLTIFVWKIRRTRNFFGVAKIISTLYFYPFWKESLNSQWWSTFVNSTKSKKRTITSHSTKNIKKRHMKDLDHGFSLPTINVYVKHKFRWMIQGVLAMRTSQRSLLSFNF
jgi:hypothetical protein